MYIDSSVLVKLVTPERDSEFFAERLEGRTGLVSSVMAFTEVWSALLQKEREQAISGAARIAGWQEFTSNLNSGVIELLSVDRLYHFRINMMQWQNGFLGVSKAAALGWAEALASAANAAPA